MTEVIRAFLDPVYQPETTFSDKKIAFREAIFFILKGYGIFLLLVVADVVQKGLTHVSLFADIARTSQLYKEEHGIKFFLMVLVLGPIVEELAVRAFMDRRRAMMSVSIGGLFLVFLRSTDIISSVYKWPLELTASLLIGLFSFVLLEKIKFSFQDNYFRIVFYLMNAFFVGMHLGNYDLGNIYLINYFFLPLLVLPQTILTIALSYVRLRNGLLWSIGLHMLNNLPSAVLFVFFKH